MGAAQTEISPHVFDYIRRLVYQHSRISLNHDKMDLVNARLARRLRQLRLASLEEYYHLLRSPAGAEETGPLLDIISTNHTRFFREAQHLEFLSNAILPEMVGATSLTRPFRLWCAACSSGEEPYSLAIVLSEYFRQVAESTWKIEASDISKRMLEHARAGIYEAERVELPAPELLSRYFQRGVGTFEGQYRIKRDVRKKIEFYRVNLFQPRYPFLSGLHTIFCRNVMIYFDLETQQHLIPRLTDLLLPGGYLIVGASESLLPFEHRLHYVRPSIYQKLS